MRRAAQIEVIGLQWQQTAQKINVDAAMVLVFAANRSALVGVTEAEVKVEVAVQVCQGFQVRVCHQLLVMTCPIKQPDFALWPLSDAPVHHAQHRCDADAAAQQYHRCITVVDMKMPCGRPYL